MLNVRESIVSRYDTDIAHALMQAVAFAMYDPECALPVGSETDGK